MALLVLYHFIPSQLRSDLRNGSIWSSTLLRLLCVASTVERDIVLLEFRYSLIAHVCYLFEKQDELMTVRIKV